MTGLFDRWANVEPREDGMCPGSDGGARPHRPHEFFGPFGPNEDIGQCGRCGTPGGYLRPAGETWGNHLSDCSLPVRHPGYCEPGGDGHPPAERIRG